MNQERSDSLMSDALETCVSSQITHLERMILQALAEGARSAEIASLTNCACSTVERRIRVLFEKLGARSRSHLVARAFRIGILTADRDQLRTPY
jgi:DNA-binding NarL/FixJ family response regulator